MTYTYNMPELNRIEFERFRGYVEIAYRDTLKGKQYVEPTQLNIVSQNLLDIPQTARQLKHSQQDRYVGFAWPHRGDMWVKPGRSRFDMQRTTIHELAHLRVNLESHGPKWRRTFGVALAMHMCDLGYTWDEIQREIAAIVDRYRKWRKYTPQGKFNYYGDYRERCYNEIKDIMWAARRICSQTCI